MSDSILPASPASAFHPMPETLAVILPVSRDEQGKPCVVIIRKLDVPDLVRAQGRMPTGAGVASTDPNVIADNMQAMEGPFARVGRAAIVEPTFAFEGDQAEGAPEFALLPWLDRSAIFNAAQALAGLAEMPESVRLFRDGALLGHPTAGVRGPARAHEPGAPGPEALP